MFLEVPSLCVSVTLRKPPRPSDCNLPKCVLSIRSCLNSRQHGHGGSPSTAKEGSYVHYAGEKEKVKASEHGKAKREKKKQQKIRAKKREKENILSNKKTNKVHVNKQQGDASIKWYQGRRRRYGRSGHGRTTFLAENGFGRTIFLADYDFFFCRVIFSADLDFLIR